MKKIIIILSVIIFIMGGCGQTSNRQAIQEIGSADSLVNNGGITETTTEVSAVNNDVAADLLQNENELITTKNDDNGFGEEETSKYWVVESDWKGVTCKRYDEDGGFTQNQECIFPNANLQQVYDIVKKVDENLKTELPKTNLEYPLSEAANCSGCGVDYQYSSEKHLSVKLLYSGGETYIEIIEDENSTQLKITYSRD